MVGLRRLSSGDLEPLEFTTGDTGSQSDLPRHHVGLPDPKVISPPCGLAWLLTRCPVFMRRAIWKRERWSRYCPSSRHLLAEAGLLNGRRAATHWASCVLLDQR
jgi:hypothetical protein